VIERRHSSRESNPERLGFRLRATPSLCGGDNRSTSAHRNGQGDGIRTRTVRVTGGDANYYITTLNKWSPWSDSHRRLVIYEITPVAAEAQGLLKLALSRGFAPRTSAFAERRAELITP
jgi:hypothetical protein